MSDILELLQATQKEFDAKKAELEALYEQKKESVLAKVKKELTNALGSAVKLYQGLPDDARQHILKDESISTILNSFGLSKVTSKTAKEGSTPKKPKAKASQENRDKFLSCLTDGRKNFTEIVKAMGLSGVTVGNIRDELLADHLIKRDKQEKDGTFKYYSKA